MPLTVLFELTIEEGAADAREVVAATLAQTAAFPGNDGVEVVVDDADPLRIVCVLHWADQPAYDAYIAWRRTPEGAPPRRGDRRTAVDPPLQHPHPGLSRCGRPCPVEVPSQWASVSRAMTIRPRPNSASSTSRRAPRPRRRRRTAR